MPISSPPAFKPSVPPIQLGAAGTVLTSNGTSAAPTFQAGGAGGVASVNGQTGVVVLTAADIAPVNLATQVTGDLPLANLAQGAALSLLGVAGNATADYAGIAAASDGQVMRRSSSALAFGAVDLASANAITGLLPDANLSSNIPLINGANVFTANQRISSVEPRYLFNETDAAADEGLWDLDVNAKTFKIRTRTSADGAGVDIVSVARGTGTAITNISFGNATNNPTANWLGSGTFTFGSGGIATSARATVGGVIVNGTSAAGISAGIYLPGTDRLGFSTQQTLRGEFDPNGNFITQKATADQSLNVNVPATGFTLTIGNNISTQLLNPAGTLATGTIIMPSTPINGQLQTISSSQTITALTLSPNSGQTVNNAPTTLTAGIGIKYIYVTASTTWYRLQ